ncbi:alpha/beta fold hydrolase [Pseudonocardia xinjiangensis]|uniref:alpha/beta fold hydrolase n=1 Tax=Pseudonocardia xinjiangensis TaxID=75289 RepID=UPI003D9089C8
MTYRRWGAALAPVTWGMIAGLTTPRGPLTPTEALISVGVSLVVGGVAGRWSRSRWAMLVAPALFVIAVEIVRTGAVGPTVDAPHASMLGAVALAAGRGVHGLLTVLPMVVAAAYGAGPARRGRLGRYLDRAMIGGLAAVVVLVTGAVALPARTDPIPGDRSIAELASVDAGSHQLGMMIRGADTAGPVLLFVPGAPGAAERGAVRAHLSGLEQHVVVATLDRRGGGSSYPAIEPTPTMTLDDEIDNVVAATHHLRQRFGADRIYLLAHSGGSIPAAFAVQRHPELFSAYIGVGQAVDTTEADQAQYAATLDWARHHHDNELAAALTAVGPPPYARIYDYEPLILAESRAFPRAGGQGGLDESLAASEYTVLDKVHLFAGLVDAHDVYYPRVRDVDLRTDIPRLEVPVYFVDGADEVPGRVQPMQEWFAGLQAPHKEHVLLAESGHRSLYERPAEFTDILVRRVLGGPAT